MVMTGSTVATAAKADPKADSSSRRVIVPPQRVQAKPSKADEARAAKAYKEASRFHAARRFKRALPHARTIWRSVPKRRSAEIYAAVLSELGRHFEAFEVLLAATDLPESTGDSATFVPALNRAASSCKPASGWARITVSPKNAIVTLSQIRVLAPRTVGLSPGAHKLVVAATGYETATQTLRVIAGVGSTFHVGLTKVASKKDPVTTPDGPSTAIGSIPKTKLVEPLTPGTDTDTDTDNTAAYVLVGTGAALAGIGVGLFVGAVVDRGTHADLVRENPSPTTAIRDEMDAVEGRGRILEIAGYVSAGVGLAALVSGVVLLAVGGPDGDAAGSVQVGATWAPNRFVSMGTPSLTLSGRF